MQKGMKQLLLLCAAAVVLGGTYAGISAWNRYTQEKEEAAEKESKEAAKIYLCEMEDAEHLEVTNENGSFAFTYDSENENWGYDKDEKFPLQQTFVTAITGKIKSLQAVRKLEDADEDLAVYGLQDPARQLEVKKGEESVVLMIGDSNSATGDYYVKKEGDDSVYTVASTFVNCLDLSEDEMLEKESFPTFAKSSITELNWKKGDGTVSYREEQRVVEPETEEMQTEEETAEEETQMSSEPETGETTEAEPETESYWLCEDGGKEEEVEETDSLDSILTAIVGLTFTDCADYYMEEEEAGQYGMDEAAEPAVLTVIRKTGDEETTLVLTVGRLTEDGTAYYVRMDDSDMVNTVAKDSLDPIMEFFGE